MNVHHAGKLFRSAALILVCTGLALLFLLPFLVTISQSFMTEREITAIYAPLDGDRSAGVSPGGQASGEGRNYAAFRMIPSWVTLEQYAETLVLKPIFLHLFWNSVKLVVPIVAGQVLVAGMAAYAFAKLRFRGRETLFFMYIITMLLPFQVTLVPNYIVIQRLGLLDHEASIIGPGVFSVFGVFLLRQFMQSIPDAYLEAARMDGAGHWRTFRTVILPLSRTGLAAMTILVFIDYWNMVEQPLIFLHDALKQPLSLFLSRINEGARGIAFAASTVYMMPMLLMFLYGENDLIEGIQMSGIKG